ncbi:MAG TPA: TonB-dependent receptor, partial [Candidatus Acidoferrum sp.]|nr:TonB-dependent receptor [Candidatus Acidoferrum sp.]
MTNTFIPTLSRQPLYCVWIETGNPAHPLDRVWIDPELRSFVDVKITPTRATNDEREPKVSAGPLPEKGLFAGQLFITPGRRKEMEGKACSAMKRLSWVVLVLWFLLNIAWADLAGRISGMVSDPSGAFVAGATVTLNNVGNGTHQTTTTNDQGQYSFPVVPVGKYELEVSSSGFQPYKKIGVVIDVNSALQIDATLQIGQSTQTVEVNDSVVTIQMSDTEIGETISSQHVAEVPLNGRSYTDLLATQAGVSPVTTSGASNSSSGGGFGTVPVAGNENTGQFSINGQRESANGFFLNGASVQESIGQQAGVIPNLDSIAEFRIISSNADAEYGGYSGGLINVVTKSGGDKFHGSAFEFLRNTNLDARGYFSPERSTFQQNQYGGTFGGPIKKSKIFFFGDYQGQRTVEGIETGIVSV